MGAFEEEKETEAFLEKDEGIQMVQVEERVLYEADDESDDNDDKDTEYGEVHNPMKLPSTPQVRGPIKPIREFSTMEIVTAVLGLLSFLSAFVNIIFHGYELFAGIFAMALGPYLYWQRSRITDIRALKDVQHHVQQQLNYLEKSNEDLEQSIIGMERTGKRLVRLHTTLRTLTQLGGQTVEDFAFQMKKQRQNVRDQSHSLKAQIKRNLLDFADKADLDKDRILNEEEVATFIEFIRQIEGATPVEHRIREELLDRTDYFVRCSEDASSFLMLSTDNSIPGIKRTVHVNGNLKQEDTFHDE